MTENSTSKQNRSITCPHCNAPAGGSFSTVVRADGTGPVEVLYKCWKCGAFYNAKKVTCWEVEKE